MRFFDVPIRSFNVEITNRCTLGCLECPRTGNPWVKANLSDLTIDVLENLFPLDRRERHAGVRLNLCGAYGDCIYHPRFHEVVGYMKSAGLTLCIETNGSHRKPEWWERTCDLLDDGDNITFSVDGLEDTNHLYRVNARWSDIVAAMRTCAPRVRTGWKYIVFRHNEHQIDEARALASEIGIDEILFKKSGRFRDDDPLAPANVEFIGTVTRNRRRIASLDEADDRERSFDREVAIRPKCRSGRDLAVTALGYLYPCTSCESGDPTSWFNQNREHFNLRTRSVADILASPRWTELESLWTSASTAPKSCLYYCGVHQSFDETYLAESKPTRPHKPIDAIAYRT